MTSVAEDEGFALNWKEGDIDSDPSLKPVNWEALVQYAVNVRRDSRDGRGISCQLSPTYNAGGQNLVRRLDFEDGVHWVVRVPLHKPTQLSMERLSHEVHTMAVVRKRSQIPVPEVYGYEVSCDNPAAVPFILMEFIPGDTAMDSFGGYRVHKSNTPEKFKAKFHATMADIQAQMSSIRFPEIGSITMRSDGTYCVGPIPGIGGPFKSASQFFETWADHAKFPYGEEMIRKRTPPGVVDEILASIMTFPSKLKEFAQHFSFRSGPFPLFHADFYSSNMIINHQHDVLSVIDWEDAFIIPWEMVEFAKDLSIVPPAMDGLSSYDDELRLSERERYVALTREAEEARNLDDSLSAVLGDSATQNLAHALWLYDDGRIGYYGRVLEAFETQYK